MTIFGKFAHHGSNKFEVFTGDNFSPDQVKPALPNAGRWQGDPSQVIDSYASWSFDTPTVLDSRL